MLTIKTQAHVANAYFGLFMDRISVGVMLMLPVATLVGVVLSFAR